MNAIDQLMSVVFTPLLGAASVKLAFFLALFGLVISVWGALSRREDMIQSGRRAAFAVWALILLSVVCLVRALIVRDYSLEYVVEQIDKSMPLYYRITALWGGMNGSLLWWTLICATFTAACQVVNRNRFKELMPWVTATCCYTLAFLALLVAFVCDPFLPLSESDPALGFQQLFAQTGDGKGLNPLLQTYWMTIHPPSLYIGYIGFTIPFAFCIAALITRRVDQEFLRATRRWTLLSWSILGFGVMLGAKWAYEELGWGGYWGWDPVENASFMPWLVATAYLHSVIIQEKRGMLKGWNVFLILLTFLMTYFGTFLTRSGIVQSVHAFGSGPVGWLLGGFVLSLVGLCTYLVVTRAESLKAENEIEAVMSREATFLYNNVGLLGFMVMVFVGTMFPVFSEAVYEFSDGSIGNGKVVVGPPFFNPLAGIITIGLLVLMGIGQLVAWRKTSGGAMMRNFSVPLIVTALSWIFFVVVLPKERQSLAGVFLLLGVVPFSAFGLLGTIAVFLGMSRPEARGRGWGSGGEAPGDHDTRKKSVPFFAGWVAFWFVVTPLILKALQLANLQIPFPNPWAVALLVSSVFVLSGIAWEYVIGTRAVLSSHKREIGAAWDGGGRVSPAFLIASGVTGSILGWAIASFALATFPVMVRLLFGMALGVTFLAAAGAASAASRPVFEVMQAAVTLFARNRRRYGGYITHFGIVLAIVGITVSSLYKLDQTHVFTEGETHRMGEFDLTFNGIELRRDPGVWRVIAYMRMDKEGEKFGVAYPEKAIYDKGEQPTTEVSIHESALRDYYLILEQFSDPRLGDAGKPATVTIRLLQSPLVTWFWMGGVLLLGGTVLAAWPARRKQEAAVAVPAQGGVRLPEGAAAKEAAPRGTPLAPLVKEGQAP